MKILTGLIGCCWALTVLFTPAPCPANDAFLASMGNVLAMSEVNQSSSDPGIDVAGGEVSLRDPIQGGTNYSPKGTTNNNGFSYANATETPADNVRTAGNSKAGDQNADSPFERYLLVVFTAGALVFVLIAAGIAQYWRRRSIKNYWLFPAARQDGELASADESPTAQLIAKKQMEILPEEEIDRRAQRRAA